MKSAMKGTTALAVAAALGAGAVWIGCEETGLVSAPDGVLVVEEGAGCLDRLPPSLPYQPGCCGYTVSIPVVTESGFDDAALGASPTPLNVHVSWAGPVDTTFAVNWQTDDGTTATQLLYGLDAQALAAADAPDGEVKRVLGHHLLYESSIQGGARIHEAHVCGLQPSTTYHYKVGAPGAWSGVYDVATGPTPGSDEVFRFAVTGDARENPAIWAQVQEAVLSHGVDFQLFSGDVVNINGIQPEWDAFFQATTGTFAAQEALARTPFMVVNGNHDALSVNFVAQFAVPQELTEGEAAQGEEWYSFDYGNAHFVALNDSPVASALSDAQRGWLEADLSAVDRATTPWIVVMHHRPMYSCSTNHGSDLDLRVAWQPIFDQHKVDVVFSGHDHLYERSKPIRGLMGTEGQLAQSATNATPVNESGTLYVITAGAGADLYGTGMCYHTYATEKVHNYVIVELEGRTMRYAAYRLAGSVLDQFEIQK
jgi:3',5'-cyclic AMP phosphodiesterase CpdA